MFSYCLLYTSRPPKADKAAPDEAQPPKPRDKVSRGKKAAPAKEESPAPEPVAVGGDTAPAAEIPAEPKEPAPPPRPIEAVSYTHLDVYKRKPVKVHVNTTGPVDFGSARVFGGPSSFIVFGDWDELAPILKENAARILSLIHL